MPGRTLKSGFIELDSGRKCVGERVEETIN
jgi:hypothetical protein